MTSLGSSVFISVRQVLHKKIGVSDFNKIISWLKAYVKVVGSIAIGIVEVWVGKEQRLY